ncbi:MAG: type I-A CRISPR-associated protein Csa5 [Candidatus Aenigmarchaeota archaeon]|nr:type I-A CRISPR-associated protein Csa5 [Candidatus Aenigmarchaeota archaeon]RLE55168.1 MAG: type I-A CRISPR-associated protein Csa5 [Candidatus Verstraetearchaeota archaeon]
MNMDSFKEIGKALGILIAEQESYTYADKLAYAPSKDLALFYLKEALRDLHSLLRKGEFKNKVAAAELSKINFDQIERELENFDKIKDRRVLRERTSSIAARALAFSAKLKGVQSESKEV